MAYDEDLARRIRESLAGRQDISEKKMFGGLAFFHQGNMLVGVLDTSLMARIGPDNYDNAIKQAHVKAMDFTGRPMRGYVFVVKDGLQTQAELQYWLKLCEDFVATLPPKAKK